MELKINLSLKEGALHRPVLVSLVLLEDASVNCCVNVILCKPYHSFASYPHLRTEASNPYTIGVISLSEFFIFY